MIKPVLMQRLSEKSIARILYYIRAEIIREGLDGQKHVDALLQARGLDPEAHHVPRKHPKQFKRGHLKCRLMDALRERPSGSKELAERVGADWMSVQVSLSEMKARALVRHEGRVWLANRPFAASSRRRNLSGNLSLALQLWGSHDQTNNQNAQCSKARSLAAEGRG